MLLTPDDATKTATTASESATSRNVTTILGMLFSRISFADRILALKTLRVVGIGNSTEKFASRRFI
jgi:hypothetical protein